MDQNDQDQHPSLDGEELTEQLPGDQRSRDEIGQEMETIEPLREYLTQPGWKVFERWLQAYEQNCLNEMRTNIDPVKHIKLVGVCEAVREMQLLPARLVDQISYLSELLQTINEEGES